MSSVRRTGGDLNPGFGLLVHNELLEGHTDGELLAGLTGTTHVVDDGWLHFETDIASFGVRMPINPTSNWLTLLIKLSLEKHFLVAKFYHFNGIE